MATDVLGRVVEVVSGQPLDRFFAGADLRAAGHDRHRLLGRPEADAGGWPRSTAPARAGRPVRDDAMGGRALRRPACLAGGGGLVSTAADYHRFTQMLLGGGELDGARLLGSRDPGAT